MNSAEIFETAVAVTSQLTGYDRSEVRTASRPDSGPDVADLHNDFKAVHNALLQAAGVLAPEVDDSVRGIYAKYVVQRADGSSRPGGKHEDCRYFVLDLTHDKFSSAALLCYARACAAEYPELAKDLERLAAGGKAEWG